MSKLQIDIEVTANRKIELLIIPEKLPGVSGMLMPKMPPTKMVFSDSKELADYIIMSVKNMGGN